MILLIDVGNTNVTIGICDGEKITASWRMTTNRDLTTEEIIVPFISDILIPPSIK